MRWELSDEPQCGPREPPRLTIPDQQGRVLGTVNCDAHCSLLIKRDEIFLFGVSNKKCQQLCGLCGTRVLAHGVVNARIFRPAFAGMEDLIFAVIDSAADCALQYVSD